MRRTTTVWSPAELRRARAGLKQQRMPKLTDAKLIAEMSELEEEAARQIRATQIELGLTPSWGGEEPRSLRPAAGVARAPEQASDRVPAKGRTDNACSTEGEGRKSLRGGGGADRQLPSTRRGEGLRPSHEDGSLFLHPALRYANPGTAREGKEPCRGGCGTEVSVGRMCFECASKEVEEWTMDRSPAVLPSLGRREKRVRMTQASGEGGETCGGS